MNDATGDMHLVQEILTTQVQLNVRIVPFGTFQVRIGGGHNPEGPIVAEKQEDTQELPYATSSASGMIWTKNSAALVL